MQTEMEDEYNYSDDDGEYNYSDDGGELEVPDLHREVSNSSDAPSSSGDYSIMNKEELAKLQQREVRNVSETLDITVSEATILLIFYAWNVSKLQDEWFENCDDVREKSGISEPQDHMVPSPSKLLCPICWNDSTDDQMTGLNCGHLSCEECWLLYLEDELSKGGAAVTIAKCPFHGCKEKVTSDIFKKFLTTSKFNKYLEFVSNSYIENNKACCWCPAPGCDYAAIYKGDVTNKEILCKCDNLYCFSCKEVAHRSIDCKMTRLWIDKNTKDVENITWIKANTKPCPKCESNIEKNQGCNWIQCGKCRYTFCWLCLGFWTNHGSQEEHGYYKCLKYEKDPSAAVTAIEKQMKESQDELKKFTIYFTHFNNHDHAETIAKKSLPDIEKKMNFLMDTKSLLRRDVEFIHEASIQIINCRRILKWTYVLAYYKDAGKEKTLLEFLQENLEKNTEFLQGLIEKKLNEFLIVPSASLLGAKTNSAFPPLPSISAPLICDKCSTSFAFDAANSSNTKCQTCLLIELNKNTEEFFIYKQKVIAYCQATANFATGLLVGIENGLDK